MLRSAVHVALAVTCACSSHEAPVARDAEVHRQGAEDAKGAAAGTGSFAGDAGAPEVERQDAPDAKGAGTPALVVDAAPLDASAVPIDARLPVDAPSRPRAVDAAVVDAAVRDGSVVDAAVPDAASSVDAPAASKADIKDVGEPGEAVTLVPVAGKVTVFDFHASWCTPCKEVDKELTALAKTNPDTVAIRRIDVEDMDTPGAEKHLVPGGFALPHVKVYDASKKKVLEESSSTGGVAGLMAKVRALVDGI